MESKYHSFTGKVEVGQWEIGQNRQFLCGCFFYWICYCYALKDIIEYDGCISMVQCWVQELLRYTFDVVHRLNRMMCDVDTLSR